MESMTAKSENSSSSEVPFTGVPYMTSSMRRAQLPSSTEPFWFKNHKNLPRD